MASFCLLHGAWHDGSCWRDLVAALEARGHDAVAPDLPLHDPRTGYAERTRPALEAIDGLAEPLVVVGHSMGTQYSPLVAAARPGSLLVQLCPGLGPTRGDFPFPERRPDRTWVWDPETAVRVMYRRLEPGTARALARQLRPMAAPADDAPPDDGREVAVAVVYTSDDEFFEPGSQRELARQGFGVEPIEIPGGHFPMIEDPEALAGVLDRLAGYEPPPGRSPSDVMRRSSE